MRTYIEFQKEMQDAHSCPESEGKIFCVMMDKFGNTFCAYCKKRVRYPNPTKEEIEYILSKCKSGEVKIKEVEDE